MGKGKKRSKKKGSAASVSESFQLGDCGTCALQILPTRDSALRREREWQEETPKGKGRGEGRGAKGIRDRVQCIKVNVWSVNTVRSVIFTICMHEWLQLSMYTKHLSNCYTRPIHGFPRYWRSRRFREIDTIIYENTVWFASRGIRRIDRVPSNWRLESKNLVKLSWDSISFGNIWNPLSTILIHDIKSWKRKRLKLDLERSFPTGNVRENIYEKFKYMAIDIGISYGKHLNNATIPLFMQTIDRCKMCQWFAAVLISQRRRYFR